MVARRMLTIVEAAEYLGTSPRHVRRLVTDHSLSHYKIGGRIRFADVELDAWLDRRKVEGRAGAATRRASAGGASGTPRGSQPGRAGSSAGSSHRRRG
jgi:excisionase family DNA binding protein